MQTELKDAVPRGHHSEGKARSLDMMRVVSAEARAGSAGSIGHTENCASASANVCPMSPQISTDGTYRFFEQSDIHSKAGSHTAALNEGSFASGDNPFLSAAPQGPRTLAEHLVPHRVPFSDIEKEWKPHMRMLCILFGAVPSYLQYLAMSDSCLKTFQLIPPNLLSVSKLLGGMGAPKDVISLALIASSQAAGALFPCHLS